MEAPARGRACSCKACSCKDGSCKVGPMAGFRRRGGIGPVLVRGSGVGRPVQACGRQREYLAAVGGDADRMLELRRQRAGLGQIGRASCRARLCQAGYIPRVAGTLKKKTKTFTKQETKT